MSGPESLATLEGLLAGVELKVREATGEASLAAALAVKLGRPLLGSELQSLTVALQRLAAEARGQRWTVVEPAAALPPRPELTIDREGRS